MPINIIETDRNQLRGAAMKAKILETTILLVSLSLVIICMHVSCPRMYDSACGSIEESSAEELIIGESRSIKSVSNEIKLILRNLVGERTAK